MKRTGLVQNLTGTKQSEQIRPKPGKIEEETKWFSPNRIEAKRATLSDPGHEIVCRGRMSACRGPESHFRGLRGLAEAVIVTRGRESAFRVRESDYRGR